MTSTYSVDMLCPHCDADAVLLYVLRSIRPISRAITSVKCGVRYALPMQETYVTVDIDNKSIVAESCGEDGLCGANHLIEQLISSARRAMQNAAYTLSHKSLMDAVMMNVDYAAKDESDTFVSCKDEVNQLGGLPYTRSHILRCSGYRFMKHISNNVPTVSQIVDTRKYIVPVETPDETIYLLVDGDHGIVSYLVKDYIFICDSIKQLLNKAIVDCCF